MYPGVSTQAYDRAITVFSPDGRLFQVEYARESVKRGTTALGIVYKDGVLLAVDKNIQSRLLKAESLEKIFVIDDHIAAAISGLVADARRLVDYSRRIAQEERYLYNEPISIESLTKELCDLKQAYTQYGGARPFGAALLIVGVDDKGKHLFETDPSGAFWESHASAIGEGKQKVLELFEKEYNEKMSKDEAVLMALKALKGVGDRKISSETVDMLIVPEKTRKAEAVPKDGLEDYLKKVTKKK